MSSSAASAASERDAGPLRVVCGPTAAGKSALALALAARHDGAVLSADSRQIYRGFDVGTAKPDAGERRLAPHYGVDVADPAERWSAARWAADAECWLRDARARGLVPVVVGGTGFYVRALVAPLFTAPELDPERRRRLERHLAALATAELRRWTATLDPARAHLGRTQLVRAVETALLAGRRISELHAAAARRGGRRARYLVVDPGREPLLERIERRVDAMLAAGWVEEVRRLLATVPAEAPAWNASGYAAVRDLVLGRIGAAEARERVVVATRQYAKRQRTWLRHQLADEDVTVLDPRRPDALAVADAWWRGASLPPPLETDP